MKASSRVLRISVCVTIFAILLIIVLYNIKKCEYEKLVSLLSDISIGLLGSSIVSLFVSIAPYNVEKKRVIKQYYNTYYKKVIQISNIDYYDIEIEPKAFLGYINERNNIIFHKKAGLNVVTTEGYKKIIAENLKNVFYLKKEGLLEKKLNKKLDKFIDIWFHDEIKKINKILRQYQKVAKISINDLNSIIGDIDYAFCNKNTRFIEQELQKPLEELLIKIRNFKFHIDLYFNGSGNQSAVIGMLFDIQKDLFRKEEKDIDNNHFEMIYFCKIDFFEDKLEQLRAKIYHDKIRNLEISPILSKLNSKK